MASVLPAPARGLGTAVSMPQTKEPRTPSTNPSSGSPFQPRSPSGNPEEAGQSGQDLPGSPWGWVLLSVIE